MRNHHRHHRYDLEEKLERNIGAVVQIRQKDRQHGGEQCRTQHERRSVPQNVDEHRVGINGCIFLEGEVSERIQVVREASDDQHDHRGYGEQADDDDEGIGKTGVSLFHTALLP